MRSTWIWVAVTDISWEPVSVVEPICSVNPDWKPVPAMVKTCPLLEPAMGFGLNAPIAGGGPVTCKVAVLEAGPVVLIASTARFCAAVPTVTFSTIFVPLTEVSCDGPYVAVPTLMLNPATKPVPLMVSAWAVFDPFTGLGLRDVSEGPGGGAFTWKLMLPETCPSGFVTITASGCVVSPTTRFTCISVAVTLINCELASVAEPTCSLNPDWKPVPVIVRTCQMLETAMGFGLNAPIAGGGPVTCKVAVLEAGPVMLIASTARFCAAVPGVTFSTTFVALTEVSCDGPYVTVPTLMLNPAPKPVPLIVSACAVFDPFIGSGLRDVMLGPTCAPPQLRASSYASTEPNPVARS